MRGSRSIGLLVAVVVAIPAAILLEPQAAFWVVAAILAALAAWITAVDLQTLTIPDEACLALGLVGAAWRLLGPPEAAIASALALIVLDAALCGVVFWLLREVYFRRRGHDGIGFGDVKLAAACGALLGTFGFAWALLIASMAGLVAVLFLRATKPERPLDRVPFGALLAPACWLTWMAQHYPWEAAGLGG